MTLDPQLTIIRTREAGADFYDEVMKRVRALPDRPEGAMFHFSGTYGEEFFSVSGYPDQDTAAVTFNDFTAPQVEALAGEISGAPDISRDKFEIVRYAVRGEEELQGYRVVKPGEFLAVLVTNPVITRERYLKTTASARFPEIWPDGLVLHVAGSFGSNWGVFDIWRGDSDLAAFYRDRLSPAIDDLYPDLENVLQGTPGAIVLHSLLFNSANFGGKREYLRDEQ